MNSQDESSKPQKRDMTFPTIMTGLCLSYVCICIGMCATLLFIRKYSNNEVSPIVDLIEPTLPYNPCLANPTGWEVVMNNNFDTNKYSWPVDKYVDEYSESNVQIENGLYQLRIMAYSNRGVYYYDFPALNKSSKNFYLASKVRQISGQDDADYGVIFHTNGEQHYFFSISNSGQFTVRSRNDAGAWKELWYGEDSENIHPGEFNELVIFGEGSHYTFCVNQQIVGELDNQEHPLGGFGIGTILRQANDVAIFEYDDLIVYSPAK
jgi:hypothetical protein